MISSLDLILHQSERREQQHSLSRRWAAATWSSERWQPHQCSRGPGTSQGPGAYRGSRVPTSSSGSRPAGGALSPAAEPRQHLWRHRPQHAASAPRGLSGPARGLRWRVAPRIRGRPPRGSRRARPRPSSVPRCASRRRSGRSARGGERKAYQKRTSRRRRRPRRGRRRPTRWKP